MRELFALSLLDDMCEVEQALHDYIRHFEINSGVRRVLTLGYGGTPPLLFCFFLFLCLLLQTSAHDLGLLAHFFWEGKTLFCGIV
jgi:hypothetical protein